MVNISRKKPRSKAQRLMTYAQRKIQRYHQKQEYAEYHDGNEPRDWQYLNYAQRQEVYSPPRGHHRLKR